MKKILAKLQQEANDEAEEVRSLAFSVGQSVSDTEWYDALDKSDPDLKEKLNQHFEELEEHIAHLRNTARDLEQELVEARAMAQADPRTALLTLGEGIQCFEEEYSLPPEIEARIAEFEEDDA